MASGEARGTVERKPAYRVVGELRVEVNGYSPDIRPCRARTILATLLLSANHIVPLGRIVHILWGEHPPRTARVQVQELVSHLRRALRDAGLRAPIITLDGGYLIRVSQGELDLEILKTHASQARELIRNGNPEAAIGPLRQALLSCSQDVLPNIDDSPYLADSITYISELLLCAKEDLFEAEIFCGNISVPEISDLARQNPLRDRPHMLLMWALAVSGRIAEALSEYHCWRKHLVEEFGVEPSRDMRVLHAQLLRLN